MFSNKIIIFTINNIYITKLPFGCFNFDLVVYVVFNLLSIGQWINIKKSLHNLKKILNWLCNYSNFIHTKISKHIRNEINGILVVFSANIV